MWVWCIVIVIDGKVEGKVSTERRDWRGCMTVAGRVLVEGRPAHCLGPIKRVIVLVPVQVVSFSWVDIVHEALCQCDPGSRIVPSLLGWGCICFRYYCSACAWWVLIVVLGFLSHPGQTQEFLNLGRLHGAVLKYSGKKIVEVPYCFNRGPITSPVAYRIATSRIVLDLELPDVSFGWLEAFISGLRNWWLKATKEFFLIHRVNAKSFWSSLADALGGGIIDRVCHSDVELVGVNVRVGGENFSSGGLLGISDLPLVTLFEVVEQRAPSLIARSRNVVWVTTKMPVFLHIFRTNVALLVATAGTNHLVAAVLFDERLLAAVARANQSGGHCFFDLVTGLDRVVLSMLLAREWGVTDGFAVTAADPSANWIGALELEVFLDRRQNHFVLAERAFCQALQLSFTDIPLSLQGA